MKIKIKKKILEKYINNYNQEKLLENLNLLLIDHINFILKHQHFVH